MKSSVEYAELAELKAESRPNLAQIYATLAIASAINENKTQTYPELANLASSKLEYPMGPTPHNDQDLQFDDWINSNAKNTTKN